MLYSHTAYRGSGVQGKHPHYLFIKKKPQWSSEQFMEFLHNAEVEVFVQKAVNNPSCAQGYQAR